MASEPNEQSISSLETVFNFVSNAVQYVDAFQKTQFILTLIAAGFSLTVGAKLVKYFWPTVDTQAIVESETYFEMSGEINPETGNEFVNQVIHTAKTFSLKQVFAEATIDPDKLIKIMRRAGKECSVKEPIVWLKLNEAMKRDAAIYKYMPKWLAEKFGHYAENDRKVIINEIARCFRNHRSELLAHDNIRTDHLDPSKREKYVWQKDMTVVIFQEGAGADVFTQIKIPPTLLDYNLPDEKDVRFIYYDAARPVSDPDNHLHKRTLATEYIQDAIKKDLKSDNPILDKFFVRFTDGEVANAPKPATLA